MTFLFIAGVVIVAFIVADGLRLDDVDIEPAVSLRERMRNLHDVYVADRAAREVRETAVGWNPGGWAEADAPTASGQREYYRVIRKGREE